MRQIKDKLKWSKNDMIRQHRKDNREFTKANMIF